MEDMFNDSHENQQPDDIEVTILPEDGYIVSGIKLNVVTTGHNLAYDVQYYSSYHFHPITITKIDEGSLDDDFDNHVTLFLFNTNASWFPRKINQEWFLANTLPRIPLREHLLGKWHWKLVSVEIRPNGDLYLVYMKFNEVNGTGQESFAARISGVDRLKMDFSIDGWDEKYNLEIRRSNEPVSVKSNNHTILCQYNNHSLFRRIHIGYETNKTEANGVAITEYFDY